ncbi:MAG: hypothetical protein KBA66_02650 [Leptospiraceae bacterium]|nr:hypothetical protein [Leptospiraceae bacterium]
MKLKILLIAFFFIVIQLNCIERQQRHCKEGVYNSMGENPYLALCIAAIVQPDINSNPYTQANFLIMCDRYSKQREKCDTIPGNQE